MLLIAFLILLLALVFTGVGLLAPWSEFRRVEKGADGLSFAALLTAFWSGWAFVIALLQIAHLLMPVNGLLLGAVFGLALAGWSGAARSARAWLRGLRWPSALTAGALMSLVALVLAAHIFFIPPHFDYGLYHMPTVGWLNAYAIVPGLGNLHHRLAFNNSNFLYAALLNTSFLAGRAYFTANTLLAFVLITQCAAGFWSLFRRSTEGAARPTVTALYWALMLPGVLWHISTTNLPGYSPDLVVFALQAVTGGALLAAFERAGARDPSALERAARGVVLFAAAGVTVKLSFAPFAALALLALAGLWLARSREAPRPTQRQVLRPMLAWAGLAALLVVPWIARGVLLSGYPLFPSAALGLPVAWRIPESLVTPISPVILEWARTVNQTIPYTGDLSWAREWYTAFPFEVAKRALLLALAAGAVGVALALVEWRRWSAGARSSGVEEEGASHSRWEINGAAALVGVSGLALVAWFLMAPDYRFSGALVWMLMACGLCLAWLALTAPRTIREPLGLAVGLVLGLAIIISPNHFELHKPGQQVLVPMPESQWVRQFADGITSQEKQTRQGFMVTMPVSPHEQCFDMPMPCTREQDFLDTLRMFEPGNLQRGFYIALDEE